MATMQKAAHPTASPDGWTKLREQYGCGPVEFTGNDNALYERHLIFDNVLKLTAVGPRERFEAVARSVRDLLSQRWLLTEDTYERENPKRRRLTISPRSSSSSSTAWPLPSMATRPCAIGSRSCSCLSTASPSPSGSFPPAMCPTRFRRLATRRAAPAT